MANYSLTPRVKMLADQLLSKKSSINSGASNNSSIY